ncbi:hypothetical protein GR268_41535, partial [Rhizobium leguminosarum]|nr:hypothetical protein [Rhizobium leguminosarum]
LVDSASKAPGVVLTYIGPGSPYRQLMLRLKDLGKLPVDEGKKTETDKGKNPPPPQRPEYYEVTIAENGPLFDDHEFPLAKSYVNRIMFYIDDEHVGSVFLHKPMDPITWYLPAGDHIFGFMVRVKTAFGGQLEQDCLTKFRVNGMELFTPQVKFGKIDQHHGRVAKCWLERQ